MDGVELDCDVFGVPVKVHAVVRVRARVGVRVMVSACVNGVDGGHFGVSRI